MAAVVEGRQALRVKVGGSEETVMVQVAVHETMDEVARQVRKAQNWDAQQHMRFISAGQELFMDDSASKALGSVLHCIASQSPAHKFPAPKAGNGQKGVQGPAVDWLEMVDPGTVLMWIFGSILALLWLLFVCYAHMFDKTSVIMLCMMTVAFLIPCVLSYVPALRMLHGSGALHPSPRHTSGYDIRSAVGSNAASGGGWPGYSSTGTYMGAIPPRPHARVRPGTNPAC